MNITREQSNTLRAIAIIMVLIGHGFSRLGESNLDILKWGGGCGVAIFLIISGYGMTESYKKNGLQFKNYWKKRIVTVMLPYWSAMILQSFIDYFLIHRRMKPGLWLLSFCGYNDYDSIEGIDSTMWYITFIMACYLIFFVSFKIPRISDNVKVAILLSVFILGFANRMILTTDWYINYFSFPIGILISIYGKKIEYWMKNIVIAISLLAFVGISTGYYGGKISIGNIWLIYSMFGGLFFVFCNITINNSLIAKIGEASYAIYLVEGMVVDKLRIYYAVEGTQVDILVYWILSVELGLCFHYIYKRIKNKIMVNPSMLEAKGET